MRPILLKTLKILALQGATRHSVHISSTDLGKKLEISQQSASRHIINLAQKGYIEKKYAQGGQIVNVNEKGLATLRKEFTEYGLIFGTEKNIEMIGTLETGLGEGGYYISKEGYMEQFNDKLNWKPYKGTFNLRLDDDEVPKIEAMKAAEGILINGFQEEGRTFGKVSSLTYHQIAPYILPSRCSSHPLLNQSLEFQSSLYSSQFQKLIHIL